jgi:hypothetical protein
LIAMLSSRSSTIARAASITSNVCCRSSCEFRDALCARTGCLKGYGDGGGNDAPLLSTNERQRRTGEPTMLFWQSFEISVLLMALDYYYYL